MDQTQRFCLPHYDQIPDVGLYLEQTAKYISEYLSPLGDFALTGSMISNYVKKGLVDSPVKKQYSRDQIGYLFFIAIAKSVLSIEDIGLLIRLQKQSYPEATAYEYFRNELEDVVAYVFGQKESLDSVGTRHASTKNLLRNAIIAVAHKAYLDKYIAALRSENRE